MKLTISIRQAVSAIILLCGAAAMACGPNYQMIPTPSFFELYSTGKSLPDFEREENLRLWQALTSERIPIADIEQAVYLDSSNRFLGNAYNANRETDNLFYTYLKNTNDWEIIDLLHLAKRMEEQWKRIRSPWHYPRKRGYNDEKRYFYSEETGEFDDILEKCSTYRGTRLKDRYALQGVRALFASRQYARCVEYYDSAFASIPDGNLMKRMAERYVAGCWSRLGETERADSVFARIGDIMSLSVDDDVAYMAKHNPNAPQLMDYIRHAANDSAFMAKAADIAGQLLKSSNATYKGDWAFIQAYYNGEHTRDIPLARKQIYQAIGQKFSSDELKDLARAYKMKLDAKTGNMQSLLSDLKWLEGKINTINPDSNDWIRRLQNIIYTDLIPQLWDKKDYTSAILLCSYADNINQPWKRHTVCDFDPDFYWFAPSPSISLTINVLRKNKTFSNPIDYSSLSFQMMGSLTSKELATVYAKMMRHTPLYDHLRKSIRTDSDYYNELIGTLALREGDYARAEKYLSKVSDDYQQTMNVYKGGYLTGDAFECYPSYSGYGVTLVGGLQPMPIKPQIDAKLEFAHKMLEYKHIINHGPTNDDRGLAQIKYAIGRRNSFTKCWALTQYWKGYVGLFMPVLTYYPDDDSDAVANTYSFLYNYDRSDEYKRIDDEYNREIEAALAMLESDEAKAKAEYILGNLKTVVARYGDTDMGRYVKSSCDRWQQWI